MRENCTSGLMRGRLPVRSGREPLYSTHPVKTFDQPDLRNRAGLGKRGYYLVFKI
jgi:hypothetical protein